MIENEGDGKVEVALQDVSSVAMAPGLAAHRRPVDQDGFWDSQEKEDKLRALFAEGLSKAQIQKEMGAPSRNVIIGKLRRLGLRRDGDEPKRVRAPERVKGSSVKAVRTGKTSFKVLDFRRAGPDGFVGALIDDYVPRTAPDVPVEQRKTLLTLTNETCRWPFNDPCEPDFYYCGDPSADLNEGRPYCEFHAQLSRPLPGGAGHERRKTAGRRLS